MKTSFLVLFTFLTGCATSMTHGSFLTGKAAEQATMASDTASLLVSLYDAENTAFALQHTDQDAFGLALTSELRTQGYEVAVHANPEGRWMPLRYIVDTIKDTQLLRVVLQVATTRYSRAYTSRDNNLHPSGPWTKFESGAE